MAMTAPDAGPLRWAAAGGGHLDPWAFHPDPVAWAMVAGAGAAFVWSTRRAARRAGDPPPFDRRRTLRFAVALAALTVAVSWPVAGLAAHWSLTALLLQRLLLTMVVAPLLLLAATPRLLAVTSSAPALDDVLATLTRPVVAVVVFTAVAVGSLVPAAVQAQSSSPPVRGAIDAALVAAGMVLWGPVLRHIPGGSRPGPVGVAAYLFVQSVVPGFPSVLYVFARHPFYSVFDRSHAAIGLAPLNDQQLAGIIGKVGTLPVLWTVAWIVLARAQHAETSGVDPDPWHWLDVERRLRRAERRQAQGRPPRALRPPVAGPGTVPVVYPEGWDEDGPQDGRRRRS